MCTIIKMSDRTNYLQPSFYDSFHYRDETPETFYPKLDKNRSVYEMFATMVNTKHKAQVLPFQPRR